MAFLEEEQSQEFYDKLFETLEIYIEEDGFHCSRCYERLDWDFGSIPDPHNCIECAECGEYETCICDDIEGNPNEK